MFSRAVQYVSLLQVPLSSNIFYGFLEEVTPGYQACSAVIRAQSKKGVGDRKGELMYMLYTTLNKWQLTESEALWTFFLYTLHTQYHTHKPI